MYGALATLTYVARTGRVPALLAGISNTLRVRPVFRLVEGGNTGRVGLTRTVGGAIRQLERVAVDELGPAPQWLMVFHADAPDEAAELAAHLGQSVRVVRTETLVLSPMFGAHTGPGTIGFAALPWPGARHRTDAAPSGGRCAHGMGIPSVRGDGGSPSGEQRSQAGLDQDELDDVVRRSRRWWVTYLPGLFALGAIAALLVYADPHKIGIAFQHFNLVYIPIVVVLAVGFYIVQGVRWWTLNRALGIKFPLLDTVFLTETGQATAMLPLGELTAHCCCPRPQPCISAAWLRARRCRSCCSSSCSSCSRSPRR